MSAVPTAVAPSDFFTASYPDGIPPYSDRRFFFLFAPVKITTAVHVVFAGSSMPGREYNMQQ